MRFFNGGLSQLPEFWTGDKVRRVFLEERGGSAPAMGSILLDRPHRFF
jgi:hypothetical protein